MTGILARLQKLPKAALHFGIVDGKGISALDLYEGSDLEKIIDAIADISGEQRDAKGSFEVTISMEHDAPPIKRSEKLHIIFEKSADPDKHGVKMQYAAANAQLVNKPLDGGGHMEFSTNNRSNLSYSLHGVDLSQLPIRRINILAALFGTQGLPEPNDMADMILYDLAKTSPTLCAEIIKRTGLEAPENLDDHLNPKQVELWGTMMDL